MKTYSIFMVCSALGMLMAASSLQARGLGSIDFSGAVTVPTCSTTQARTMVATTAHHELAAATFRHVCPSQNTNAATEIRGAHTRHSVQISAPLAATSPLLAYFVDYTSARGNPPAHLVTRTFD